MAVGCSASARTITPGCYGGKRRRCDTALWLGSSNRPATNNRLGFAIRGSTDTHLYLQVLGEAVRMLKASPFFSDWTVASLERLYFILERRRLQPGEDVVTQATLPHPHGAY